MKENLYLNGGLAIINYNAAYPRTEKDLLSSARSEERRVGKECG